MAILVPLAVLVIFVGFLPNTLMTPMLAPIQALRQPIGGTDLKPKVQPEVDNAAKVDAPAPVLAVKN